MAIENIQNIKNSFLDLLKEKKYPAISIQEITDRANVSRRTFYQYFENKYQLFEEIMGDFIEWSLRPFEKSEEGQVFSSKIGQFTYTMIEHLDTVECLFDESCPAILANVIEKILITQIQEDSTGFFINRLPMPAAQQYYVEVISQSCASSIRYILKNKHMSKEELVEGLVSASHTIAYFYNPEH